jgi:type I restriction enzyme, S subunit
VTLPTGWVDVALGEVCELLNGRAYKQVELLSAGKWPVLRVGNFFSNRGWYYSDLELEDDKYCDNGDLLYAWSASFGPRIWEGGKVIFHYHIWKTQPDPNALDKGYLYRWFDWDTNNIKSDHGTGTTMIHVTKGDMEKRSLPLPPLAEQRRIVAKLDTLTARLRRARTELDRVAEMAKAMRRAALLEAFDQPDTPLQPLTNLGKLQRGHSKHRPRNDPRLMGGKYPFVQTGDIRSAHRFLTTYKTTYSDFGLAQSRLWPRGTLAITIAANIAETAILGIDACFPDSVVGFTPEQDVTTAEYVEYFFRVARADLDRFASATAQKNINLETLRGLQVPCPSISRQSAIVERLNNAFARADRLEAEAARARALLDRLEAAILARAFRGELVPQDPTDEPATTLLNRIREARAATPKPKRGRRAMAEADSNLYRE